MKARLTGPGRGGLILFVHHEMLLSYFPIDGVAKRAFDCPILTKSTMVDSSTSDVFSVSKVIREAARACTRVPTPRRTMEE